MSWPQNDAVEGNIRIVVFLLIFIYIISSKGNKFKSDKVKKQPLRDDERQLLKELLEATEAESDQLKAENQFCAVSWRVSRKNLTSELPSGSRILPSRLIRIIYNIILT